MRRQLPRLRWFVVASALVFAGALAGLNWLLERALREEIQASTEIANQTFARVFVNENWESIRPMLGVEGTQADPRANPHLKDIDAKVRAFARGTDLMKVKIYDPRGLTVYSSDPGQIGEDKSGNAGFLSAARGRTVSELNFRGKFGSFDGDLYQRNLVSSYVPVRGPSGVEAVVELYTDRTAFIESLERRQLGLMLWVTPALLALFVAFVGLARLASRGPRAGARATDQASAGHGTAPPRQAEPNGVEFLASLADELSQPAGALDRALAQLPGAPSSSPAFAAAREAAVAVRKRAEWIALLAKVGQPDGGAPREAADPAAQVKGAVEAVAPRARAKGLDLQSHFGPRLGQPVFAHPSELAAILEAVLTEAVDATDEGFVHVKLSASVEGLQFDVIDSARASDALPEAAASDPSGQARFRLVLADGLVRGLGGVFHVRSTPGVGHWVTFSLPLAGRPGLPARSARAGD